MTKFTFVIPAVESKSLQRTIDNFIQVTESNYHECVVVINKTSDKFVKCIAERYKKYKNIKILRSKIANISNARNLGIISSSGNYIVFMDSDCIVDEDYIIKLKENVGDWDVVIGKVIFNPGNSAFSRNYSKLRTMWYASPTHLYCPNMIVKKSIFSEVGYFDPSISQTEDSEWSLRAVEHGVKTTHLGNLKMYHDPEFSNNIYLKWIKYGRLRGYYFMRNRYYKKRSLVQTLRITFLSPYDRYRLRNGFYFIAILLCYRMFRFVGSIYGIYSFREAKSHDYFEERIRELRSEWFIGETRKLLC